MDFILAKKPNGSSGLAEAQHPGKNIDRKSLKDHTIQSPRLPLICIVAPIPFLQAVLLCNQHSSLVGLCFIICNSLYVS